MLGPIVSAAFSLPIPAAVLENINTEEELEKAAAEWNGSNTTIDQPDIPETDGDTYTVEPGPLNKNIADAMLCRYIF